MSVTDAKGRRFRGRRQSTGKRNALSPDDLKIFNLLYRYRYLDTNHLYAFFQDRNFKWFQRRLSELFHEKNTPHGGPYLDRPDAQYGHANMLYRPAVYSLNKYSLAALIDNKVIGAEPYRPKDSSSQFTHDLITSHAMASLEIGARETPSVRFIPWEGIYEQLPEETRSAEKPYALHAPVSYTFPRSGKTVAKDDNLVIPDGKFFGLAYELPDGSSRYRFLALETNLRVEVRRNNLSDPSHLKKFLGWREIAARRLYHTRLGLPNLQVLMLTTDERMMRRSMQLLEELTRGKGSGMFLFKTAPALGDPLLSPLPMRDLFTGAWERVGYPSVTLSKVETV